MEEKQMTKLKRALCIIMSMLCITSASVLTSCGSVDENIDKKENTENNSSDVEEELKDANGSAHTAYNHVVEILSDSATNGEKLEDALASFAAAASSGGMDLSAESPTSKKDALLYNRLKNFEYLEEGTVIIGQAEINGYANTFFIQFKSASDPSVIGQYPNDIPYDKYKEVEFGKYYTAE